MIITVDAVRNKNQLLNTDAISDTAIEEAIEEAYSTVKDRLEGVYDLSSYNDLDDNYPYNLKLYTKLIAAGNLIISFYPDQSDAIKVAEMYKKEAFDNIKAILDKQKRLNIELSKNPVGLSFTYEEDTSEIAVNDFISNARCKYL